VVAASSSPISANGEWQELLPRRWRDPEFVRRPKPDTDRSAASAGQHKIQVEVSVRVDVVDEPDVDLLDPHR
jgi:hypothetical protein